MQEVNELCMLPHPCGGFAPGNLAGCKGALVQTGTSWQIIPWVLTQAGNRASKTRDC